MGYYVLFDNVGTALVPALMNSGGVTKAQHLVVMVEDDLGFPARPEIFHILRETGQLCFRNG